MRYLILIAVLASQAFGATYYVSTSGSDSAAGSSGAPWLTCQKAAQTMVAGDTTVVLPGTYLNTGQGGPWNGSSDNWSCQFANSGTSGNVITLECQTRGACIFDGGVTCGSSCDYNATGGAREYISTGGHSYLTITGFVIQNTGNDAIHDAANTSANIIVQQCEMRYIGQHKNSLDAPSNGIGEQAVYLNSSNSYWTFDADSIHDIGRTTNSGQTQLHFDHGIYSGGSNLSVTNSIFYNITEGYCMQIDGGTTIGVTGNVFYASCGPYVNTAEIGSIELWSNNTITSITFEQNIFYNINNGFGGYALGTYMYTGVGTNLFDYNDIYGSGLTATTIIQGGTPANWTNGTHIISANPSFVNVSTFNFALNAGSACISAGANLLTHDYLLNPRVNPNDIGAYQYIASSPTGQFVSINGTANQLLNGQFPIQTIGTGGLSANPPVVISLSGNISCPNCLTSSALNPLCVGGGCPSVTPGTGGTLACPEGTAPSAGPASSVGVIYCDSATNKLLGNFNNAGYLPFSSFGQVAAHNGTYTVLTQDATNLLTTNTVAAWTLPQCGSTGFPQGFWFAAESTAGSSQLLTITTTTSTFTGSGASGSTDTTVYTNDKIYACDGTNWHVMTMPGRAIGSPLTVYGYVTVGSAASGFPWLSDPGNLRLVQSADWALTWDDANGNAFGTIDTGMSRNAAGIIDVGNGTAGNQTGGFILTGVQFVETVVGSLPTCNTAAKGTTMAVSDALTPAYNVTLTGGSTGHALAYCNGTNWTAH